MKLPDFIRFVIFDADGTLLDSMPMWDGLDAEVLRGCGVTWTPEIGSDLRTIHYQNYPEYLFRKFGITGLPGDLPAQIEEIANRHYAEDVQEKPGAAALLKALREKGIHCCVATASQKDGVEAALARLGLLPKLDFVMSCSEVGKGKDAPDIFHACAVRLGGTPADTAVAEDSFRALRTAAEAGYFTVGVWDAGCSPEDTCGIRKLASVYAETLGDLLENNEF